MTSFFRDKSVFVTGATGFVGSWLVRSMITEGASVVVLIRDWDTRSELIRSGAVHSVSVVNGRLEDFQTLERAINEYEIDTVFHLGAQTIVGAADRSPLATFEANIRGSYNLLEACRIHGDSVRRVVIASSDKAYGKTENLPYREDHPLRGSHPYEVSKSCADLLSQSYWKTYRLPVAIARCGNIFGGGDFNWSRVVPGTINALFQGTPPIIRSDGQFTRDYIFVDDVVEAYKILARGLDEVPEVRGEAFNFSPQNPVSVLDVVQEISDHMGRSDLKPVILNQAQGEIRHQHLSSEKAYRVLGWKPAFSVRDGLEKTIAWYKEYLTS